MSLIPSRRTTIFSLLPLAFLVACSAPQQGATPEASSTESAATALPRGDWTTDGEWLSYAGDRGSKKYSDLDQIDRDNVHELQVAWRWSSPDNPIAKENRRVIPFQHEVTPIVVNGVMYASTSFSQVAALNPETGETLWVFDTESWKAGRPTNLGFVHRGVAYWTDGTEERLFIATGNAYLWAIDAKTGTPIASFGDEGKIDLAGTMRRSFNRRAYAVSSPPVICRDVVAVGSSIFDGPTMQSMPPGDVRGYNVRTGELAWTFHNPPIEGEPGYETWDDGSADYTGNANVWTIMSADEELGYLYLPFGTPTNDWYGGHRKGQGLYGESLVCVEATTGKMVWYFQTTHHGLWDYDLCAAPVLADVTVDGEPVKAIAQVSKQGFLYVFDRVTGEPVWPIEEQAVPQSDVEGEESWPTQPIPTKPAPYELQGSFEEDLIDFTPELKAAAVEILKQYKTGPLFTPPSADRTTIYNPGWGGGANWMGGAFDPYTGIIYVTSMTSPIGVNLQKPDPNRSDFRYMGRNSRVKGPEGLPLFKPPYGRITAIDLNTGDQVWQVAHGDGPRNHPLLKDLDLPPLGDSTRGFPLVTKTLLFAVQGQGGGRGGTGGGADKPNFRAFDKATGEVVAEMRFPGPVTGAPMTYRVGEKQYIVYPVGGGRTPSEFIALSLP